MSLAYEILRYIARVMKDPSAGSDPRLLARLENYALEAFEGIVALHAPASPMSWEINAVMKGNTQTTARIPFRFPRPVEIVGFFPTLVIDAAGGGGALNPSTDTIAVQIDTDTQAYLTSSDGVSTPAGGKASTFVTLSAMSVQVPRIVGYKLRNPTPDVGFTFRWKQDVSAGAVYKDTLVSVCMYARYIG